MPEQVICSKSGNYTECNRDCCLHREKHLKYDRCEIATCGDAICIPTREEVPVIQSEPQEVKSE